MKVRLIGSPFSFSPDGGTTIYWLLEAEKADGEQFYFLASSEEDLLALMRGEEVRLSRTPNGNIGVKRVNEIELPALPE